MRAQPSGSAKAGAPACGADTKRRTDRGAAGDPMPCSNSPSISTRRCSRSRPAVMGSKEKAPPSKGTSLLTLCGLASPTGRSKSPSF